MSDYLTAAFTLLVIVLECLLLILVMFPFLKAYSERPRIAVPFIIFLALFNATVAVFLLSALL